MPNDSPEFALGRAMLKQAVVDAMSDDREVSCEARSWLSEVGADLAEALNIVSASVVRQWAKCPTLSSLSPLEVSRLFGINRNTVYTAIRSGDLCAIMIDKNWRVVRDDAVRWANSSSRLGRPRKSPSQEVNHELG